MKEITTFSELKMFVEKKKEQYPDSAKDIQDAYDLSIDEFINNNSKNMTERLFVVSAVIDIQWIVGEKGLHNPSPV